MNKKIIVSILSLAIISVCAMPAMAKDAATNQDIEAIDSYMKNVVHYTHNPFSTKNSLKISDLSGMYETMSEDTIQNDELAIKNYCIEDCRLIYNVCPDFFSELQENEISVDENNFFWYLPAENEEGNSSLLAFKERNDELEVVSMSIFEAHSESGFLTEAKIQDILQENNVECIEMRYFNMPLHHETVVCAQIKASSGEDYVMIVDNSMQDNFFKVGYLYTLNELSLVFENYNT